MAATITSSPSASASGTVDSGKWWLKDPLEPAGNIKINIHSESLETTSREAQAIHYPLGRTTPVVEADSIYTEQGAIDLSILSDAEFEAFELLRNKQRTLLLQSPYGHHLYLRLGAERRQVHLMSLGPAGQRIVGISFIQIDAP